MARGLLAYAEPLTARRPVVASSASPLNHPGGFRELSIAQSVLLEHDDRGLPGYKSTRRAMDRCVEASASRSGLPLMIFGMLKPAQLRLGVILGDEYSTLD